MTDGKRLVLTVLLAAWVVVFGYAFFFLATAQPTGDGFTRGLNRITGYLGWQGLAGMIALAIFGVGRSWPKGSSLRKLTAAPIAIALMHVAAILGIILWARFSY